MRILNFWEQYTKEQFVPIRRLFLTDFTVQERLGEEQEMRKGFLRGGGLRSCIVATLENEQSPAPDVFTLSPLHTQKKRSTQGTGENLVKLGKGYRKKKKQPNSVSMREKQKNDWVHIIKDPLLLREEQDH